MLGSSWKCPKFYLVCHEELFSLSPT
jgi:hypothetical protein